tara:strand:- start:9 stop:479 length:471 start_codon:yes stop_codon:yes gene_type:complete
MPNYAKGQIYMVCSNDGDMEVVYYGSTTQTLSKRMALHRWDYTKNRECTSRDVFDTYGLHNCHIELLEMFPCSSKAELERAEYEYIRNNKCVNYLGSKGYSIDKKKYKAEKYAQEKEQIAEYNSFKTNCECGSTYTRNNKTNHFRTQRHQNYLSSI